MRALVISGDKSFGPGNERYELQRANVDELAVVYWGRYSLWPKIPNAYFDVVTVQDPFWRGLFAWYTARRLGALFNVQVHTDLSVQSLARHLLARSILRHSDSIRVVSEKIKKQVESMGVRAKITVLPVFVNLKKFRDIVRREHVSKKILWIGRFEKEKNPIASIEIFKEVLKTIPDAKLVLLGSGSLKKALLHFSTDLPISAPGWQNPALFLDTADVVLCTSWHESWGSVIVETLAARVPVVAPDVGIAREAGAIVVAREDMAQAVIKVLSEHIVGELKLQLPDADTWAKLWLKSLE